MSDGVYSQTNWYNHTTPNPWSCTHNSCLWRKVKGWFCASCMFLRNARSTGVKFDRWCSSEWKCYNKMQWLPIDTNNDHIQRHTSTKNKSVSNQFSQHIWSNAQHVIWYKHELFMPFCKLQNFEKQMIGPLQFLHPRLVLCTTMNQ